MKKISIIIVGRDDNYGDDISHGIYNLNFKPRTFLQRLKYSIETNISLFEKYFNDDFEYIVVDWSPIDNRLLIDNTEVKSILHNRNVKNVIVTPNTVSKIGLNPKSFYEYYGKNVGIRNAEGEFILITNSDDYFTEELVREIYDVVQSGDRDFYYRPKSRKDIDDEFNINAEGPCFNNLSIFGQIGTPAAGDFTLSHRKNIIEIGEGYSEKTLTSLDENHRQVSLDGALVINMYLRGIKPHAFENSFFSFDHNKIERFNGFEDLSEYENTEDWGLRNYTVKKNGNTIIYDI